MEGLHYSDSCQAREGRRGGPGGGGCRSSTSGFQPSGLSVSLGSLCQVRVARVFNTYGPRMDPEDGRVVSNFIMKALQGEPLTVYGSGDQTRSFQVCCGRTHV